VSTAEGVKFGKILGSLFKEEREKKGISKNRLAEDAGVARTVVIYFERQERMPTIHNCKALADALGVPLSRLVKRAEQLMVEPE
jgi:transcriptional regulator with XRE-family HTH domain